MKLGSGIRENQTIKAPRVLNLGQKVKCTVTPELDYPKELYDWLRIKMREGKERGRIKYFLRRSQLLLRLLMMKLKQFMRFVSKGLPESKIREEMRIVEELEETKDVRKFMVLCS